MNPVVPLEFQPSPAQAKLWSSLLIEELGVDVDGWWMGWCPLCDKERKRDASSAQFNFLHGVMRCEAKESCTAPKRAMSFMNVLAKLIEQSNG